MDGLNILFEDNHLLVVNKNPGILVQNDKTGDISLLDLCKQYIKKKYSKKSNVFLGLVHRIDRPVSGTIIFAKSSKSLSRLNNQFKLRDVKKTYWAIVNGVVYEEEKKLIHWLLKKSSQNKSFTYNKEIPRSKKSILQFKKIHTFKNYTLLRINLETGRHHQIRAQLSSIGYPIKGDLKYGAPRSNKNKSIHLHCRSIEISHPVNKKIYKWIAPTPKDALWSASPSD